ncbi:MAG: lipoyl(octanoyl) transferase [Desulfobacteraceae bacterium]|nr:MAG: lipoyl(octanoyl) transferase [Desulfobacteraceae bacterium]
MMAKAPYQIDSTPSLSALSSTLAAPQKPAYLLDLALTDYNEALELQRAAVQARRDGRLDRDLLILLEHPPVFTLGRRGGKENLLVSENWLAQQGIRIVPIERGGDITYHGPGQLVVYPIVDLNRTTFRVVGFVEALEKAMIQTAAHWGITARDDTNQRGAWVEGRKLGSVGITVRRGVSFHGLALNVHTDLTPFGWINPCGIQACQMTSLAQEKGQMVEMGAVRREMARQLGDLLGVAFQAIDLRDLKFQI